MNTLRCRNIALLALAFASASGGCSARTRFSVDTELRAGLESPYVLAGSDGRSMLGIVIRSPDSAVRRVPVALALVIDCSDSMGGEKIEHARSAGSAIVDALADGDEVSVTIFSTLAQTLAPLAIVDAPLRKRLKDAIAQIGLYGGTAIFAGMQAGLKSLDGARSPVHRLILLSDGQANVGPSTADAIIAGLAPSKHPVTLSTIGFGTDYDEVVMAAIARHGTGRFHHLNDPVQLTQILEDELNQAHTVVGTNAIVEIVNQPGVEILDAPGLTIDRSVPQRTRVVVGDLYAGSKRTVMLPVRVPVVGKDHTIGNVRLSYVAADRNEPRASEVAVRYSVTPSRDEVARGTNPELMVAADRTRVAHALTDAAALLKEGDLIEAQTILRDERTRLVQRFEKLSGSDRTEAEALIGLLRDPYIDATPSSGTPPPRATPETVRALVERARQGKPLVGGELASLDAGELRFLRNVPYARHGYPFSAPDLQRRFQALGWYDVDASFDNRRLDRVDADNIALVHSYEGRHALARARPSATTKSGAAKPSLDALLERSQRGQALSSDELAALDLGELRMLRNTSYARHGFVFRTADLQAAFGAKSWYHADPSYAEVRLTPADNANIRVVQQQERSLLANVGSEALRDFELRSRARASQVLRR